MSRILVTGGTGFVGRAVVSALKSRDQDLRCVVRNGSAQRLPVLPTSDQIVEVADLFAQSTDWWRDTLTDIDMVIHLAWYAEPGKYLTSSRNLDCLSGTLAMAQGAAQAGVRRIVGVGTCFEYDLSLGHLSSDARLDPITPYAAAKAATFMTLNQWLPLQGIEFLWARLFYLYGKGEDTRRLVPYLHQQMQAGAVADLTSGTQVRDFMDVEDAADLLLVDAFGDRQGSVNICGGQGITVRQLAETIADQYGRRDLLNFGARADNLTDPPCVVGIRDKGIQG
jgi:dTDP-6-deoxy-L-talose 4-dehydrogenase (NAD+)